ncbi:AraC-type DNA-binding protein [Tangfeifania diversioriginum]|uniref:AraC-type DNA-binding protein n=1 Tax=Tangfeifania diversioriginum TaxID=1168035 RepID=A0A1M6DM04_9BACT|nr:AraC family transcriptional regulator [Tangfeifania diversioriginum]SHI74215.1 AraC-type DNA-binding protein [Tangfeifania diversioriginum]
MDDIQISHNIIDYHSFETTKFADDTNFVRLHIGLGGSYDFNFKQINRSFLLSGYHNNIMYSDGLDIEVHNNTKRIETLGINFSTNTFIEIGQNGNEPLKRFTDKVINRKNCILSDEWKTNNFKIRQVLREIIDCTYNDQLRNLFLLSKSIELLVLQAELHEHQNSNKTIKSGRDKQKLIEAREFLSYRIDNPPTIVELSKQVGVNEYKLKKGFKELFGTTVFGYIHKTRMFMAKQLLLETGKPSKEIAYETGYSSPQHFSNAFKKEFGISPNCVRNNPDSVTKALKNSSNLDFNQMKKL